jgi:hypothetical protein
MKYFIVFILNLIVLFASAKAKEQLIFYPANNSNIQYVGRIDFSNPQLPRFWQPGVYVNIKFKGSSCKVILNDEILWGKNHNYLEIVIDGKAKRIQTKQMTDTILIAENLSDGIHDLTICKNTESNIGYVEMVGVLCEKLLKPTVEPTRKIEFFGNSITCGASSDMSEIPCGKGVWHDQHNAYMAYGPVMARAFNAQYHLSSVSGIGLMHSCCGMKIIMPQVFDKVNMSSDTIAYDFNKYIPDLVTICLGQNDGIQDSTIFCNNYIAFIKQLRVYYPKADIVCLSSPMADGNLKNYMVKCLSSIVDYLNKEGDKKIQKFVFAKHYTSGCDSHPSVDEHTLIANELIPFIKNIKHW